MSKEDRIRKAAAELRAAIADAPELHVTWPGRPDGLDTIEISETGRAKVVTEVRVDPSNPNDAPVDPKVAAKVAASAQAAADKTVAKEEDRAAAKK